MDKTIVAPPSSVDFSQIELNTYAALQILGVDFIRQKPMGWYTLDAFLPDYNVGIECQGCIYHGCPECGYGDMKWKIAKDKHRAKWLNAEFGVLIVPIWGHDLQNIEMAVSAVAFALAVFDESCEQAKLVKAQQ